MTCCLIVKLWETALGLAFWCMIARCSLYYLVELLEMPCAEEADALAPQAEDLKAEEESLASDVCVQEV